MKSTSSRTLDPAPVEPGGGSCRVCDWTWSMSISVGVAVSAVAPRKYANSSTSSGHGAVGEAGHATGSHAAGPGPVCTEASTAVPDASGSHVRTVVVAAAVRGGPPNWPRPKLMMPGPSRSRHGPGLPTGRKSLPIWAGAHPAFVVDELAKCAGGMSGHRRDRASRHRCGDGQHGRDEWTEPTHTVRPSSP